MVIAYFVRQYTFPDGTERILAYKANHLVDNGHEVHIIASTKDNREPFFYFDPRVKFYDLDIPGERGTERLDEYIEKTSALVNQIKPDISIANGDFLTKYIYKLKDKSIKILESHFSKYKGKTKISMLSQHWYGRWIGRLYSRKQRKIIEQFSKYVLLTDEDREQWNELAKDKTTVIPNMITIPVTDRLPDYSKKRVIGIGRLSSQKGWEYLLKSWKLVHQKHPDWELVICGEGNKRPVLEKYAQQNGIADSLKLVGLVRDVSAHLTSSSIYVMSSRYEGQPLVLGEAMSAGLPVVSFACKCGPKDLIRNGEDGLLVDLFDTKQLAKKLDYMMSSEEHRRTMGQKAKKNILRYSEEKIMQRWYKLFDELLEERVLK